MKLEDTQEINLPIDVLILDDNPGVRRQINYTCRDKGLKRYANKNEEGIGSLAGLHHFLKKSRTNIITWIIADPAKVPMSVPT